MGKFGKLEICGNVCVKGRLVEGRTQVIMTGHEKIDHCARTVIFDRMDWKVYFPASAPAIRGTFEDKCGIYELPAKAKQGTKMLFYNHHSAINILMHPDPFGSYPLPPLAPETNAEFQHIIMNGHNQVIELEWIDWNHGWTVIRNEGGSHGKNAHVASIKFHSPDYLYTICTLRGMPNPDLIGARDFVATVDINPEHVEYGTIVNIALGSQVSSTEDQVEYHHGSLCEIDGNLYFVAPSLNYKNGRIDFFNLSSSKAPVLSSYLSKEETTVANVCAFHTTHVNPQTGNIIVSYLGSNASNGDGPGGFVEISPNIGVTRMYDQPNPVVIKPYYTLPDPGSATTIGDTGDRYNYDFAIDPCNNELVCTSWGPPSSFDEGFDITLAKPYGRAIRVFKMPHEGTNGPVVSNQLTLIKEFVTDPTPELGGPSTGEGVVPLEVRRVHMPDKRIYFVGITLPGAIDLLYYDETIDTGNVADNWLKKVIITPSDIIAACENASVLSNPSPQPSVPEYNIYDAGAGPKNLGKVPLVTDVTLSQDDQFLYISCWLAGALLQYDVSDPHHPVFVGGIANLGGVRGRLSTVLSFNTGSHSFADNKKKFAGGPQMLRLDPSGTDLYVTNSLFSSWDKQFYDDTISNPHVGSIEINGGMLIKLKTNIKQGTRRGAMYIDTDFGDNGVISFSGLSHPSVSGTFTSRCHESHIIGTVH